jgi:hypothetical protein
LVLPDSWAGDTLGAVPEDSRASIAAWYRRERFAALGLTAVDSMTAPGAPAQSEVEIDEADPRLEAVRVRPRERLQVARPPLRRRGAR